MKFIIANPHQFQKITIPEYLDWKPKQDCRYEYFNEQGFAMVGGTFPRNNTALSFYRALYSYLRSRGARTNIADVKVQVSTTNSYYYPDVPDVVVSGKQRDLNTRNYAHYSQLIIEVLYPGIEGKDRGEKLSYYRTVPTRQEYIIIESQKTKGERYHPRKGTMRLYYPCIVEDTITLESIEFNFGISCFTRALLLRANNEQKTELIQLNG